MLDRDDEKQLYPGKTEEFKKKSTGTTSRNSDELMTQY